MQDICPSTNRNEHIFIRTLHEACVILGGERKLAQYLGVEVQAIESWLNGKGQPSDRVFLKCIDLIEERRGWGPRVPAES